MKDAYTVREAAKLLNVKVRTMREWIKMGRVNPIRHVNGWYWLIPASEIERVRNGNTDTEHTE